MECMSHRKRKETKQQPDTAGPGNILGCCLVSLRFLWDIHSIHPVENVEKHWVPEIRKLPGKRTPFLLVGTKKDLRKEQDQALVRHEEGRAMASKLGAIDYMECSAITEEGLTEVFEEATR